MYQDFLPPLSLVVREAELWKLIETHATYTDMCTCVCVCTYVQLCKEIFTEIYLVCAWLKVRSFLRELLEKELGYEKKKKKKKKGKKEKNNWATPGGHVGVVLCISRRHIADF